MCGVQDWTLLNKSSFRRSCCVGGMLFVIFDVEHWPVVDSRFPVWIARRIDDLLRRLLDGIMREKK